MSENEDVTLPPIPVERVAPRPAPPPRRRLARVPWKSLVLVAVLAIAAGLEAVALPATPEAAVRVEQDAATSGVWYCPATTDTGSALLSVAAAGDIASQIVVVRHTPEGAIAGSTERVEPGTQLDIPLEGMQAAQPVSVRWSGGPSVVTWRAAAEGAMTALPCATGPAPRWYVTGLDTARGASSALYLFNPYPEDAVARLTFTTADGPRDLVTTSSELVDGGTIRRLDLNGVIPEVSDLGVEVTVENGRLVAAGEVNYAPLPGVAGPTGRTLLPGAEEAAEDWAFGYAAADQQSSSWLTVMNPGEREAAVRVVVSDPLPESELLQEYSVPARGTLRVPLDETSASPEFGALVESVNDEPVVVTRTSAIVTDDGRAGVAASLGASPASSWALAGGGAADRAAQLSVYNPESPVTVQIDAGEGTPEEWAAFEVPANDRLTVDLAEVGQDRTNIPLIVSADGPVVTELRSLSYDDPLRPWTVVGVPAVDWSGPATRPAVRRDPALRTTPIGLPSEVEGDL